MLMTQANTFIGVLNGRFKVYIDPYSANQNITNNSMLLLKELHLMTQYVLLPICTITNGKSWSGHFQPKIGFKTRYGNYKQVNFEGSAFV